MTRALILIAAIVFFREVLPRTSRLSSTAVSPYMSALDGIMSSQQARSVSDEVAAYDVWLASHRAGGEKAYQHEFVPVSLKHDENKTQGRIVPSP
jgi:hypothetical protein